MEPSHIPDPVVPGQSAGDRRFSIRAVVGAAIGLLGVAAPFVAGALARPGWDGLDALFLSVIMGMGLLGSGLVVSATAWVQIVRSRGRLRGLWLAIAGTLLPVIPCAGVLLFVVGTRTVTTTVTPGPVTMPAKPPPPSDAGK